MSLPNQLLALSAADQSIQWLDITKPQQAYVLGKTHHALGSQLQHSVLHAGQLRLAEAGDLLLSTATKPAYSYFAPSLKGGRVVDVGIYEGMFSAGAEDYGLIWGAELNNNTVESVYPSPYVANTTKTQWYNGKLYALQASQKRIIEVQPELDQSARLVQPKTLFSGADYDQFIVAQNIIVAASGESIFWRAWTVVPSNRWPWVRGIRLPRLL